MSKIGYEIQVDTASGVASLNKLEKGFKNTGASAKSTGRQVDMTTKLVKKAGVAMSAAFAGVGVTVFTAKANKAWGAYESSLTDMAKVTDESLTLIDEKITALDKNIGSSTELMQGYYQTISAGVTDPQEAMDLMVGASKAAKAAHTEQADVIKVVTKMMKGYGGEIKDVTEATDTLFKIEQLGQTSFKEMVPLMGELSVMSKDVGLNVNEMGGALAYMTQVSGSTSEAVTKVQAVMTALIKPTKELEDAIKASGDGASQSGRDLVSKYGFVGALEQLQLEAGKSGKKLSDLFGRKEAIIATGAWSKDMKGLIALIAEMENKAGKTDSAFAKWEKTWEGIKSTFDATIADIMMEMGREISPAFMVAMEDFSTWAKENKSDILDTAKNLGALAKALGKVGGAIAWVVGQDFKLLNRMFTQFQDQVKANWEIVLNERHVKAMKATREMEKLAQISFDAGVTKKMPLGYKGFNDKEVQAYNAEVNRLLGAADDLWVKKAQAEAAIAEMVNTTGENLIVQSTMEVEVEVTAVGSNAATKKLLAGAEKGPSKAKKDWGSWEMNTYEFDAKSFYNQSGSAGAGGDQTEEDMENYEKMIALAEERAEAEKVAGDYLNSSYERALATMISMSMEGKNLSSTLGAVGGTIGSAWGPIGSVVGAGFGGAIGELMDPQKRDSRSKNDLEIERLIDALGNLTTAMDAFKESLRIKEMTLGEKLSEYRSLQEQKTQAAQTRAKERAYWNKYYEDHPIKGLNVAKDRKEGIDAADMKYYNTMLKLVKASDALEQEFLDLAVTARLRVKEIENEISGARLKETQKSWSDSDWLGYLSSLSGQALDYKTLISTASDDAGVAVATVEYVDALEKLWEAEQEYMQVLEKNVDALEQLRDSVGSLRESLLDSSLNPDQSFNYAQARYNELMIKAQSGDAADVQAYLNYVSTYLEKAQEYYKSTDEYQAIFDSVVSSTGDLQSIEEVLSDNIVTLTGVIEDLTDRIGEYTEDVINSDDYSEEESQSHLLLSTASSMNSGSSGVEPLLVELIDAVNSNKVVVDGNKFEGVIRQVADLNRVEADNTNMHGRSMELQ